MRKTKNEGPRGKSKVFLVTVNRKPQWFRNCGRLIKNIFTFCFVIIWIIFKKNWTLLQLKSPRATTGKIDEARRKRGVSGGWSDLFRLFNRSSRNRPKLKAATNCIQKYPSFREIFCRYDRFLSHMFCPPFFVFF